MKENVLLLLEEARAAGKEISGEWIAEQLGVSRAAVWKIVKELREAGHRVDAAPRRGYNLLQASDVLTEEGIRANLSPNSKINHVICLSSVDSTNTYAKKLIFSGTEEGTLVVANEQTAGRGRRGHSFVSPPGTGLYMTLILRPKGSLERFQMITIAAAVATCLALEELTHVRPLIKWVNDVYIQDEEGKERKVCGILTEAVSGVETGEIESVVVGIGLNVRTRDFGEDLEHKAGSIFPENVGRDKIAAVIAEKLMDYADKLEDPEVLAFYRKRALLTGRDICWMQDCTARHGRAVDVDERGGLIVEYENGERETLRSGEVFEIRHITSPENPK